MFTKKRMFYGVSCFLLLFGLLLTSQAFSFTAYAKGGPKKPVKPTVTTPTTGSTPITGSTPKTITRSGQDTVVFVHGIDLKAVPPGFVGNTQVIMDSLVNGCDGYWGDMLNYMRANHGTLTWGRQDFRTVGFYNGDTGCSNGWDGSHSPDLHASEYANHCNNYNTGHEGNFNESLYHLSCLFAWYIYNNFGQHQGWNVEIVAHSMGGLIVHNAIYQVQYRSQLGTGNTFPPTLGHISDVVTFNSPHAGHNLGYVRSTACNIILQCKQMDPNNPFTQEMQSQRARNSQAGGTDWTLIGSECDGLVGASSATQIWDVGHKIAYTRDGNSCYNHGEALHDQVDGSDAMQSWCDWQDAGAAACNTDYTNFVHHDFGARGLFDMLNALWSDQW